MQQYIKYISKITAKNYKTLLVVPALAVVAVNTAALINKGQNPLKLSNYATEVRAQEAVITVPLHNTVPSTCDVTEWHFIITNIEFGQTKPAYITITWSDGSTTDIALNTTNPAPKVAHYNLDLNDPLYARYAELTPVSGSATIYATWDGQFNTSHGPCVVATPTPTTMPTVAPTSVPTVAPTATPTAVPTVTETPAVTVAPTTAPTQVVPTITVAAVIDVAQPEVLGVSSEIEDPVMPDTSAKVETSSTKNVLYALAGLIVSIIVIASDKLKALRLVK